MSGWDNVLDPFTCPICMSENCVPFSGPTKSKILILGDKPDKFEMGKGRAFVGGTGEILRKELAHLGLDLYACKLGNLWLHPPNDNEDCFEHSLAETLSVSKEMDVILLAGAEVTKFFIHKSVTDVNGLRVESDMLSAPVVIAMYHPAIMFHGVVGEVRFALKNFVEAVK